MSQFTQEQKLQAFELYLSSEKPTDIARTVGVPPSTVKMWIENDGWRDIKREFEEEIRQQVMDRYRSFIVNNRPSVAEKQLMLANELNDLIHEKYKRRPDGSRPYLKIKDISVISKALKDATDIAARAVGLGNHGSDGDPLAEPKRTLVIVGAAPKPVAAADIKSLKAREAPF